MEVAHQEKTKGVFASQPHLTAPHRSFGGRLVGCRTYGVPQRVVVHFSHHTLPKSDEQNGRRSLGATLLWLDGLRRRPNRPKSYFSLSFIFVLENGVC